MGRALLMPMPPHTHQQPQVKARPPSFAAFVSGSRPVAEDAVRFLAAELREALGFQGVPVRIWFR